MNKGFWDKVPLVLLGRGMSEKKKKKVKKRITSEITSFAAPAAGPTLLDLGTWGFFSEISAHGSPPGVWDLDVTL